MAFSPSERAPAALPRRESERRDRDQQRHQTDVDELQARAERLDLLVEPAAHLAQLLADLDLLVEEPLQLRALFRRQDHLLVLALAALQRLQFALGLGE